MARQPFLPRYKGTPAIISPDIVEKLPRLAQMVGRIVINWSAVDLHLSLLLQSMIGVESAGSVALFLALRNHRAQRDGLMAVAEKTLSDRNKELFDTIMILHKQLDSQRNDCVHCMWGYGEKTLDGIIWTSLQDHANMLSDDYHRSANNTLDFSQQAEKIVKNVSVYKYSDLESLNTDIVSLYKAISHLHVHLRYPDKPAGASALLQLEREPLIQSAIARMRSDEAK